MRQQHLESIQNAATESYKSLWDGLYFFSFDHCLHDYTFPPLICISLAMRHVSYNLSTLRMCTIFIYTIDDAIIYYRKIQSMNKGPDCTADRHAGRMPFAKKESRLKMEASKNHTLPAIKHRTPLKQNGSHGTGLVRSPQNQPDLTLRNR